jgi:fatty-acyl-CoA synthase
VAGARSYNLVDLFESVVDVVPERTAVVCGDVRLRYADLDERANRFAHALADRGIGRDDHVGLLLYNGAEYVEAMLGAYKLRAVPVNLNYRYVESELAQLAASADLVAVVAHEELAARVPPVGATFVVADGSGGRLPADAVDYEAALASASHRRDFGSRSDDDLYVLYTGGTTGSPKGVVWRHEDIFWAALVAGLGSFDSPAEVATRAARNRGMGVLPVCPLMHASGQWNALTALLGGGTVVLPAERHFDAASVLRLVEAERVGTLTVVGDAAGRPLADELESNPSGYDVSSLVAIASGGSIFSADLKARFLRLVPGVFVIDSFGASESGAQGMSTATGDGPAPATTFTAGPGTTVVGDDLRPVAPGEVGRIARSGHVPLRYHNDPERSATTFFERDGVRWTVPGDHARLEPDGTITLLGRGSLCINTGGEKVYPEEVEVALRSHPAVVDALVTGVEDERWGEVVAVVVQAAPDRAPTLDELRAHCRDRLAGYKLPRRLQLVEQIPRSPAGKADYAWARAVATAADRPEEEP